MRRSLSTRSELRQSSLANVQVPSLWWRIVANCWLQASTPLLPVRRTVFKFNLHCIVYAVVLCYSSMQLNLAVSLLLSLLRTQTSWYCALGCAMKSLDVCTRSAEQRPGPGSVTSSSSATHCSKCLQCPDCYARLARGR